MATREVDQQILQKYQLQYRALAARLAQVGFLLHGSVHTRWLTCGRADCECSTNPQARHGPYVYWTSKEKGRSVARLLHPPETEILSEWQDNRRELEKTLTEMRRLSQKALKVILRLSIANEPG